MEPNGRIETGHCRDGLHLHKTGLQRLKDVTGCISLAFAVLLAATGITRAQTTLTPPAGMALIAHNAALVPITVAILFGGTPASIPATLSFLDGAGAITTFIPTGPVTTSDESFFDTSLTTNGRSCFTCHMPQAGWAISPPQISTIYVSTAGKSPLFQPIDSANCPNTPGATASAGPKFLAARSQLFNRGNFRIAITAPNPLGPVGETTFEGNTPSGDNQSTATPQWVLTVKSDPTGCENDPTYGLPAGLVSVYRRTMPSANVAFLDPGARNTPDNPPLFNIMWDAREPSLTSQFVDATEFHGQQTTAPTSSDATAGAGFQSSLFTAQTADFTAGDLTGTDGSGATGGPVNLFNSRLNIQAVPIPGVPVPNLCFAPMTLDGVDFCPGIFGGTFDLYTAFASATSKTNPSLAAKRQSIARGEVLFDTKPFTINDVAGLNDAPGFCRTPPNCPRTAKGTCSSCHNNSNVANDNFLDPKREGIMDNSNNTNNALPPSSDFPLFAFYCPSGSISYFTNPVQSSYCQQLPGNPATCDEFDTTDPGEGLADGECSDLGKMKVPVLHSLAARAPFFHGGNVATLLALVNFYNTRFSIGLSAQDKTDLVNFLNTL